MSHVYLSLLLPCDTFVSSCGCNRSCMTHWLTHHHHSKLEQLEQELKSIKQVVQPATNGVVQSAWTPPSPRAAIPALPEQKSASAAAINTTTPRTPTPQPESSIGQGHPGQSSERRLKTGPTEARILGNHIVSGEDIDWYFTK